MALLFIILRPLSWLYAQVLKLRHKLYDRGAFESKSGPMTTIVIGNLELGGTGKSPMTDHLLRLLSSEHKIAMLSRGYGRKSKGYLEIRPDSTVDEVGDEPLMLKHMHPDLAMAVCEDRMAGLAELHSTMSPDIVVLDDAFQHRPLMGGFNVLLTPYSRPFWDNHLLPEGTLRDVKDRARAAHAIVVTKCPADLSEAARAQMKERATWYSTAPVHFAGLIQELPRSLWDESKAAEMPSKIILVTGIADSLQMLESLRGITEIVHHIDYGDHHHYTAADAHKLKEIYTRFADSTSMVVTTAKDAVKLRENILRSELENLPIYYLPIKLCWMSEGIDEMIKAYAQADKRNR